jgi:hypothetical protein
MVNDNLDQLKELSRLSGATVDVQDDAVKRFLEICERRNLFAHTGGIVSNRYIKKCKFFKIELQDGIKVNSEIGLDRAYFTNAAATLHELCIKLCHFIWHKVVQEEHELADLILHNACLDLIRVGDSAIARKILQYVTNHTKISTDVMRIKFILLYATALKLSGEAGLACKELDSESWSVTEVKYRILVAAIKDDKETVFNLLDKAAKSGEVTLDDLRAWPAFGAL